MHKGKLQFIWIKIANNPLNTLHYLQKAHLSSDTKLIDLADINIYDASVHTYEHNVRFCIQISMSVLICD